MRHKYRRRPESEMPVVHRLPAAELANGEDSAPTREAAAELGRIQAEAIEASDPAEREAMLAEIQDRFGNEAARETVARIRAGSEGDS